MNFNLIDYLGTHLHSVPFAFIAGVILTLILIFLIVGVKRLIWLSKELVKMYSANDKSYFSKKRLESGVAFVIAEHGAIFWLANKYSTMSTTDFCMWAGIQLTIAGWMIGKIQQEKKLNGGDDNGNGDNGNGDKEQPQK